MANQGQAAAPISNDLIRALTALKKNEGGFVDNPADPGGATKYGITLNTLQVYYNQVKPGCRALRSDIVALDWQTACDLYQRLYWNASGCDQFNWPANYIVFDYAVNSGVGQAARDVQRIVGASPDGTIGDGTRSAIQARKKALAIIMAHLTPEQLAEREIATRLTVVRLQRNNDIRQTNPKSWQAFIAGWLNRNLDNLRIMFINEG